MHEQASKIRDDFSNFKEADLKLTRSGVYNKLNCRGFISLEKDVIY